MTQRNAQETLDNIQYEIKQITEDHLFKHLDCQTIGSVIHRVYRTFNFAKSRGEVSQYEIHSFYYNVIIAFQLNHIETMSTNGQQEWIYIKLEFDHEDPIDVTHVCSIGEDITGFGIPYFKFKGVNVFLGERRKPFKYYWYREHADQDYYDDFLEGTQI